MLLQATGTRWSGNSQRVSYSFVRNELTADRFGFGPGSFQRGLLVRSCDQPTLSSSANVTAVILGLVVSGVYLPIKIIVLTWIECCFYDDQFLASV